MGAISATMWTLINAGDSVVIDRILYGNTFASFTKGLSRFGVNVRLADFTDPETLARGLAADDKIRIVYFETPANPNLRVTDIARVSSLAKSAGALAIVDNTFATPILQNPLKLGADLVVHSATKYFGGHGDLLGGAVVGSSAMIERIRGTGLRALTGAMLSPLNAFLILRA
jgi:methionine-gamma-lyase